MLVLRAAATAAGAAGVELTPDDLREIEDAASKIDVVGERLPEDVLGLTNR